MCDLHSLATILIYVYFSHSYSADPNFQIFRIDKKNCLFQLCQDS